MMMRGSRLVLLSDAVRRSRTRLPVGLTLCGTAAAACGAAHKQPTGRVPVVAAFSVQSGAVPPWEHAVMLFVLVHTLAVSF